MLEIVGAIFMANALQPEYMNGPQIILLTWMFITFSILVFLFRKGKKALSIFPDIDSTEVIYRDRRASGWSDRTWLTRISGANRVLDVVVTDKELWLKTNVLFAGVGSHSDLIHKLSLSKITGIQQNNKRVQITFKSPIGNRKQFTIITKKPTEFVEAMQRNDKD